MSRGKPKENIDNNIRDRLLQEKEMLKRAKYERQKIQEKINKLEQEKSYRLNVIRDRRKSRFANHDFKNEKESKMYDEIKHKEYKNRKYSIEQIEEDHTEQPRKKYDVKSKKKMLKEEIQKD